MGSDSESDPYSIPKLPLFSITPYLSAEPSGTLTPPLQTAASVPFRWEEQPGKPRPCTDLIVVSTNRCLDLPPRLATVESNITAKTCSPSPTTVLDGPGPPGVLGSKSLFSSSSFRFEKERRRRQGSFDSNGSGGWSPIDDSGGGQQLLLPGSKIDHRNGGGGLFGSFRLRGSRKLKDSFLISRSSSSSSMKGRKMRRNSSVSKVIRSKFWAKIYEGFKQVVPWRKKPKMDSFTL